MPQDSERGSVRAMQSPLSEVKVLDFSQNLPGPYATFLLASWGADVVKVEPPKGDPGRNIEPFFTMVNRGKRSVVLDLRDEGSRASVEALVRWADVLVDGFRPGVMDRLGVGYEAARALNPRIVYCSISAFGQQGPLREHPGHDLDLQAFSGVAWLERDEAGAPSGTLLPIADLSSSLVAVSSICAALAAKDRDATYLDVAMADAVLSWSNVWGLGVDMVGPAKKQLGNNPIVRQLTKPLTNALARRKLYAMPHYEVFECKDGRWLSVGIVDEAHFWKALCEELRLKRLAKLPMPMRVAVGPVLKPIVARRLKSRPRDHWITRFRERGIPSSPVNSPEEAAQEAQVHARPFGGDTWLGSPLPGSHTPRAGAPERGEHTDTILRSLGVR